MTDTNNLEKKKDQVKDFFSTNAKAYAAGYRKPTPDLTLLLNALAPQPHWTAIDVGAGTGRITVALAPLVRSMTAIDLTPAMEVEFWQTINAHNSQNVRFVIGDAEALPFPDAVADLVTCARAAHHFPDINQAVYEMARVLKLGGKLGLIDMAAPEDTAAAELFNKLERARDASHACALSLSAWRHTLTSHGFSLATCEVHEEDMCLSDWLSPVSADGDAAMRVRELITSTPLSTKQHVFKSWTPEPVLRKRRVIITADKQC